MLVCWAGMDGTFLPETDWHDLLREIHNHQVIPIVRPEMVTVREPSTGIGIPLYRALAPKLAAALGVPTNGSPAISLNRVACDHSSSARFLADNILRVFVFANSEEDGLAKLLVAGPF